MGLKLQAGSVFVTNRKNLVIIRGFSKDNSCVAAEISYFDENTGAFDYKETALIATRIVFEKIKNKEWVMCLMDKPIKEKKVSKKPHLFVSPDI